MPDDARQPVAIRIARPYTSEDAFLEHELDTLTRTSVVLVGAQSRPQGVVLRFEVTLASGAPLLRGEGRVVAYKATAYNNEPGLTLRFTRLDPRSKALVDRAAALRDARARSGRSSHPGPLSAASMAPSSSSIMVDTGSVPPFAGARPASARPRPPTSRWPDEPASSTMHDIASPLRHEPDPQPVAPPPESALAIPDSSVTMISDRPPAFVPAAESLPAASAVPVAAPSSAMEIDIDEQPIESENYEKATPNAIGKVPIATLAEGPPPLPKAEARPRSIPPPLPTSRSRAPLARPRNPAPAPPRVPTSRPPARAAASAPAPASTRGAMAGPPAARRELLERLRNRARDLPAERRQEILATKRTRP